jgi:hypothetical protein
MYRKILPSQVLQEFEWGDIDAWIVDAYRSLIGRYLADRRLIPPGNLVEIRYEELDKHPVAQLEDIYERLDLGDFARVRPSIESYLARLGTYEKNKFEFPADVVETVNDNWGFAFDTFGYERLESTAKSN